MRPGPVLYWNIDFVGSLRTLLHAQTPTPLHDTTFSVIVTNDTQPWNLSEQRETINVAVNGQTFLVYHTDACCWEAASGAPGFTNINITAAKGFEVTIETGTSNDIFHLFAWVGGE